MPSACAGCWRVSEMTRIKRGVVKKRRHKKLLKQTKGHKGVRHRLYRRAHESLIHALQYSYAHRRERKGDMRRLWNVRVNAAARANGISYSRLIHGLKLAGVAVNRKMLAELAVDDPDGFAKIAAQARAQLEEAVA
jgi:large subunit ribosomal protein L20